MVSAAEVRGRRASVRIFGRSIVVMLGSGIPRSVRIAAAQMKKMESNPVVLEGEKPCEYTVIESQLSLIVQ